MTQTAPSASCLAQGQQSHDGARLTAGAGATGKGRCCAVRGRSSVVKAGDDVSTQAGAGREDRRRWCTAIGSVVKDKAGCFRWRLGECGERSAEEKAEGGEGENGRGREQDEASLPHLRCGEGRSALAAGPVADGRNEDDADVCRMATSKASKGGRPPPVVGVVEEDILRLSPWLSLRDLHLSTRPLLVCVFAAYTRAHTHARTHTTRKVYPLLRYRSRLTDAQRQNSPYIASMRLLFWRSAFPLCAVVLKRRYSGDGL